MSVLKGYLTASGSVFAANVVTYGFTSEAVVVTAAVTIPLAWVTLAMLKRSN